MTTRILEPTQITTRESLAWTRTFTDYKATEWTLAYRFRGTGTGFDVTATADGDAFAVAVGGDVTAKLSSGRYDWQAWVTNIADSTNVRMIGEGRTNVRIGFDPTATSAVDLRTPNKLILDAINAAISGQATEKVLEYEVSTPSGMKRIKRMMMTELLAARKVYAELVAGENAAERARSGKPLMTTIKMRVFDQ